MTDLFNRPWIWGSLIVVLLAYQALSKLIYSRLVRHTTILRNLDTLGRARTDGRFAGTAVVAGGRRVFPHDSSAPLADAGLAWPVSLPPAC
jgi:hypothetical protein